MQESCTGLASGETESGDLGERDETAGGRARDGEGRVRRRVSVVEKGGE